MTATEHLFVETTPDGALMTLSDGPVNRAFGLTYASYLVWPRVLMEHMPLDWQERFVTLLDEYWERWSTDADVDYAVQRRDASGRFARDPLVNYRRPNRRLIEALARKASR